ncbi:MAG: phage virion morphogenesis protein [Proteobacteria bacterium]|nr:phage virion morphogenesis protein [Pseudomonadota bacterium]
MLTITIQDQALQSHLQLLRTRLQDLTPAMEEIGNTLENRARQRFQTATDPNGAKWAPWKPSTVASYPFPGTPAAAKIRRRQRPAAGPLRHHAWRPELPGGKRQRHGGLRPPLRHLPRIRHQAHGPPRHVDGQPGQRHAGP